jgi:hypothetical protein
MSLSFYLCRAPEGAGPVTAWESNLAEPLGEIAEVKARVDTLFPHLRWTQAQTGAAESWSALGANQPGAPYLDLRLSTGEMGPQAPAGQVHFIVGRKMPPSVMRSLMGALDLNHVSCPDTGDLVDPWAYDDEAPYFAKKAWLR